MYNRGYTFDIERSEVMYEIFEFLLQEQNITAYKVSKETGVTQSALSNWKRGKSTPSAKNLQKIANFFNVSIDYLMTGKNKSDEHDCYIDQKTTEIVYNLSQNDVLRHLFEDAQTADLEDLETIHYMLRALKHKEEKFTQLC